jgi:hypothetical protein
VQQDGPGLGVEDGTPTERVAQRRALLILHRQIGAHLRAADAVLDEA